MKKNNTLKCGKCHLVIDSTAPGLGYNCPRCNQPIRNPPPLDEFTLSVISDLHKRRNPIEAIEEWRRQYSKEIKK